MRTIHLLLDTKAKREYAVCLMLLFGWMMECLMNIIFLVRVLPIQRLESLYDLIPVARYGMIGRLVVAIFQLVSFDIVSIVQAMGSSLSVSFVLLIAMSFYVLTTKYRCAALALTKTIIVRFVIWMAVSLAVVAWYALFRLEFVSYQIAMNHVLLLARILLAAMATGLVIVLIGWIRVFLRYLDALQYDAIEVIDQ